MSNPSLILPQSPAYGEDYVYAAQVEDGAVPLYNVLPLTFTRASGGTRINKDGLVQNMPYNLLENSNSFNSGAWILQNITSSTGIADPFGGNTGWQFNETTATNQHRFYYSFLAFNTGIITQSIYVKSLGRDQIWIGSNSNTENLIFTFSTGAISSVTGYTSTSATNVGNGWYRITATFFGFSPINCVFVQGYNGGLSYAGDTSKGFCAFGAQINIGSTAQPYLATMDRLNMPRITYPVGGGCGALLLEKQSTNLATYSEDFTNAAYIQSVPSGTLTITANYSTSPDGTQNADRFQYSGGSQYTQLYQLLTHSTNVVSIYVKSNTSSSQTFRLWGNDFAQVSSNLTATTSWQRFDFAVTGSGTKGVGFCTDSSGNALDISIWGFQFEASSYATSYIPTTSTSATRIADACYKTGISNLIGQTEGVLFSDFVCNGFQNYGTPLCVNDGTTNNSIWLTTFGDGTLRGEVYGSGTIQATFSMSGAVVGQRYKMALAYKANDFAMYINGTQIGTDSSGTIPSNLSRVDYDYANPSLFSVSLLQINQSALYKTRLTNAELATLTTI